MEIFKNGSIFLKADFHLHTKSDKEFKFTGEENSYVKEYISKLKEKNIRVGVITNHNKFNKDEYKALSKEARKEEIYLLPGIELNVNDGSNGVHTLIVFNPEEWLNNKESEDYINKFVTAVSMEIANFSNSNLPCNSNLDQVIKTLNGNCKDYFIIMAHVDDDNGLFKEITGSKLQDLVTKDIFKDNILAFQKSRTRDNIEKLEQLKVAIPALVEGSDCKCIDEIGKGQESYIKLGDYNFEAVKYALKDHDYRTSNKIQTKETNCYLNYIKFTGGKLEGKEIYFSKELNNLIGIRGSGKSTILEIIRYAIGIELKDDVKDKEYKDELIKNALGSGGKIEILVTDEHNKSHKIIRILGQTEEIYDELGNLEDISINSFLTKPLYFGQKDLSNTDAGFEHELLLKLLGNKNQDIKDQIQVAVENLNKSIDAIILLHNKIIKKEEYEQKIKDYNYKLGVYKDKGIEEKLQKEVDYNTDEAKINEIIAEFKNIKTTFEFDIISKINFISNNLLYESKENKEIFSKMNISLNKIKSFLQGINDNSEKIENENIVLSEIQTEFLNKKKTLVEEFAEIKRELNVQKVDSQEFLTYKNEVIKYTKLLEDIKQYEKDIELKRIEYRNSLSAINNLWFEEFELYKKEVDKINLSQKALQISIEYKGDKEAFKNNLKTNFAKTSLRDTDYQKIADEFLDYIEISKNIDKLKDFLTETGFGKFKEKFNDIRKDILSYQVPNKIEILYKGKLLKQHSIGQRASALLLFILAQEDNSIIMIDQPEDDIDNQTIYEDMIKLIRKVKNNIQFIFATHNANIPVLGDCEQLIACEYNENEIKLNIGSVDHPIIQDKIVEILEGGKEAFEKRRDIYNLWN